MLNTLHEWAIILACSQPSVPEFRGRFQCVAL